MTTVYYRAFLITVFAVLTAGCEACDGSISSVVPTTPSVILQIQGPSRLEVGQGAAFTAQAVGSSATPAPLTWSASPATVLQIETASGAATAKKAGTATVTVSSERSSQSLTVLVTPKARLLVVGLPPTMLSGTKAEVKAVAMVDSGDGEEEFGLGALASMLPGSSTAIQWSTSTATTVAVSGRALPDDVADVEGRAPGTGIVQVSIAGLTGTAFTTVLAVAPPTVTPPPTSPGDLATGTYSVTGRLESNTCAGTSPLTFYTGRIVIGSAAGAKKPVTLSYLDERREFQAQIEAAFGNQGEVQITSDVLPFPFGSTSPISGTRLTGRVNPTSATPTALREEMTCGTGSIVFRIDTLRMF